MLARVRPFSELIADDRVLRLDGAIVLDEGFDIGRRDCLPSHGFALGARALGVGVGSRPKRRQDDQHDRRGDYQGTTYIRGRITISGLFSTIFGSLATVKIS